MKSKKRTLPCLIIVPLILIFILLLSSCSGADEPVTLKMAMLPIMDTLPAHVAEEQGYFADENLIVEFLPVGSAPDRDQLIKSGQADGMVNEVVSTIFYNRDETQVQIVRYARTATPNSPIFFILASGQSGISSVDQIKGVEIGVSHGTVIEYLTDRLLQARPTLQI